jgi:hypothetical protein
LAASLRLASRSEYFGVLSAKTYPKIAQKKDCAEKARADSAKYIAWFDEKIRHCGSSAAGLGCRARTAKAIRTAAAWQFAATI